MKFENMNNQELEQSIKQTVSTLLKDINSLKEFFNVSDKCSNNDSNTNWSRSMFEPFNMVK